MFEFGLEELAWPVPSPVLNLTEHLWRKLVRRLLSRPCCPTAMSHLTNADLNECSELSFLKAEGFLVACIQQ